MESILKAIKRKNSNQPTVVISNKPDAKGLKIAKKNGNSNRGHREFKIQRKETAI